MNLDNTAPLTAGEPSDRNLIANMVCAARAVDGDTAISFQAMRAALGYAMARSSAGSAEEIAREDQIQSGSMLAAEGIVDHFFSGAMNPKVARFDQDEVDQLRLELFSVATARIETAIERAILALGGKGSRDERQAKVAEWCAAAFGAEHQASIPQRGLRHAEEAIEAAQAAGVPEDQVAKLVAYIYARPPGELRQELGGAGLTLLALAAAAGESADEAEADELARVLSKPLAWFHARNEVKNAAGFDALSYPSTPPGGPPNV